LNLDWDQPARIMAAPGHTPGSVAVFFEDAGVLVAGDAMASHDDVPMVGVFNADVPQGRDAPPHRDPGRRARVLRARRAARRRRGARLQWVAAAL
jgi:glyoxylase-like metal-dependent hydrolase (beta-lactamase superfamily II)